MAGSTPDELEVISSIVRAEAPLPKGYSQIGDDVAVIPVRGRNLVMKVDTLVQSTDVPRQMTFRQAARKSAAMCVSDFAAKGVKPDSFMVSLGLAKGTAASKVTGLSLGFRDACREWGLKLVGGDTSETSELSISCAMVGYAGGYTRRTDASPGDVVAVSGYFGYPPAGLKILLEGAKANPNFRRKAVRSVLMPTPNLKLGLALSGFWTAAMDSSDGLAGSLHEISRASKVRIEIRSLPTAPGVAEFAAMNHLNADKLVLQGGEEYLMVGTMKPNKFAAASRVAKENGGGLLEVGRVAGRKPGVVIQSGGDVKPVADSVWVHLR